MTGTHWLTGIALAVCAANAFGQAQKFPSKPIRMLVGFAPGGATDIVARAIAPGLSELTAQSVVVENRPGASSQIAGELVAKSPPDGHVLMMTTQTLMTSMMIERKTFPDIVKDFSHVALAATSVLILVANPSFRPKSVKELIELARARPGEINYASGGVGTTPHLSGELFATIARLKITHVPYKGEAPGLVDVIGGHIPFMFSNVSASLGFVQSGKLRALASTGLEPSPAVPELPTMASAGLPGFEVVGFFGVLAPANTPREIVARLNGDILKVLARPDIKKLFASQALDSGAMTAPQFGDYVKAEVSRWGKLIQEAGIKS
ncbi:MAG: tripartite tricarboxylate transporter substrate binding protein [Burkholderiales bacterium]|nr:tripartite tricarboxylate transporter substrate binding protein [Burkholderiales bacterium]